MKHKSSEKLCNMLEIPSHHRSKRKAPLMLFCFGFNILVATILVLTTVFFILPSTISPSLAFKGFHFKFLFPAHWKMKNSTQNKLAGTIYIENGFRSPNVVSDDLPKVEGEMVTNETSAVSQSIFSSGSSESSEKKQESGGGDSSSDSNCDMFDGEWVRAKDQKQYYSPGSCPYVDRQSFACYENGRPDDQYLQWKWQRSSTQTNAAGCNNVPSFLNATDFLERLRGKKMVFVGDSLNYNMYTSVSCIFWNAIPDKTRISKPSGKTEFKSRGDFSLTFEDYNCTVVFVWSAFLVYETHSKRRKSQGVLEGPETLRLDVIDEVESSVYRDAAVVVFDSFHWWVEGKTNNGINFFQEGDYLHPKLEMIKAYKKGLTTWRKWIDKNIDSKKTQVVFRGFSETHYVGGRWNTGGKCNLETEPIMKNATFIPMSPPHVKILEDTLRKMKTPVLYLNVSKLTYYRADGHPSVYAKNYTMQERIVALDHQDCSHWCLPGVPDTWNELLYLSLLKAGKASFSR